MSSDPVIVASGVSKRYRLGEREQYRALRDVLSLRRLRTRAPGAGPRPGADRHGRDLLWALDDVSFEVAAGDVVAVIGRNGAGKSTLLKILSRITTPTSGRIEMEGRVGSLLEVGSGFHPELTGIENVHLNGAILGMGRREIRAKLDEIVAFAEMEQFVTTPVKHYSVGMFMRLAFAVAAHLDSEILIVDEVLAVGDARFQQKCLAKMGEVARSGRSVLFVSHNLEAVAALCDRGLLLDHGRLVVDGPARDAIDAYRQMAGVTTRSGDQLDLDDPHREGTGEARFAAVTVTAGDGRPTGSGQRIRPGDRLQLDVTIRADEPCTVGSVGLTLGTEDGHLLLNLDTGSIDDNKRLTLTEGENRLALVIPRLHLAGGRYRLGLRLANPVTTRIGSGAVDLLDPAFVFQVDEHAPSGTDEDAGDGPDHRPEPCPAPVLEAECQVVADVTQGRGSVVEGRLLVLRPPQR